LRIEWPEGKKFAFTIFDDPDSQTLEAGREVYALLGDLGFRTTKAVWPSGPTRTPSDHGVTCADPACAAWLRDLQAQGFELAFHNATSHTSSREETLRGLDRFRELFGADPRSFAQHYFCAEGLYWGDQRVTGANRLLYNLLTRGRNFHKFHGDQEGHPLFWADLCHERIQYVRNFVFADIDTLRACPEMPYHDPRRPSVNYWFAASEGAQRPSFVERIGEANQDRLVEQGHGIVVYVRPAPPRGEPAAHGPQATPR